MSRQALNDIVTHLISHEILDTPTNQWVEDYCTATSSGFASEVREIIGEVIDYSIASVSDPPTDAQLDSAFGQPSVVGSGFLGILNNAGGGTSEYLCWSDSLNWFLVSGVKAT